MRLLGIEFADIWNTPTERRFKLIHYMYYKHFKESKVIWADKKWAGFLQISLYID